MADRVPWPRKTGGTWGPTTHSTCSPPFLVHSRAFHRCENTRENRVTNSSMEACSDSCHQDVARPEDLTESLSPLEHSLPFPLSRTAQQLRSATVRLPSGTRLHHVRASSMHCATRVGIRFNDALAIWQLMGCVTDPSDDRRSPQIAPPIRSPGGHRRPLRGDRLASGGPTSPGAAADPPPSRRSAARYAQRGTVIYFFG